MNDWKINNKHAIVKSHVRNTDSNVQSNVTINSPVQQATYTIVMCCVMKIICVLIDQVDELMEIQ